MRILIVHNRYRQPGGEDVVVESEAELLRSKGHDVLVFEKSNDDVHGARGALSSVWSRTMRQDISRAILEFHPDIVHVHNVFHAISPAIYGTISAHGIPVVQTLHNFRLFCIRGTFEREGSICERCVGRTVLPGVILKCYRGSWGASLALGMSLQVHRFLNTFQRSISVFVALNDFCRDMFIRCGLPEDRVLVKPNFIDIADLGAQGRRSGGLYVGRMSSEKGIGVLASALKRTDLSLTAIGSGSEDALLAELPNVAVVGSLPRENVFEWMRKAEFLVMPSVWYETFGLVIIEAYACRLPVIASNIGAMSELVDDGKTGLLFEVGSASDLADKLRWAKAHPEEMRAMGNAAREKYERNYTSTNNYAQLMELYRKAYERSRI